MGMCARIRGKDTVPCTILVDERDIKVVDCGMVVVERVRA